MADVALWLGPYMSISSKTSLYTDPQGPTMQANHNEPKTTQKQPDDPQIPQPDLRFATRKSKPDTKKGPEPKRKHPQKRICLRTQRLDHCVSHKNMPKTNYPPRPSVKHGNQRIVPAFVSIDAENCTCLRAYKLASLSVLSDVLVQKATT